LIFDEDTDKNKLVPFCGSLCIFGRAAITLGIGPHSSFLSLLADDVKICRNCWHM